MGALTFAPSQRHAAEEAGMSLHQQRTAIRAAYNPEDDFEELRVSPSVLATEGLQNQEFAMSNYTMRTSRPNNGVSPPQHLDPNRRRLIFGRVRPMKERGLFQRILRWF